MNLNEFKEILCFTKFITSNMKLLDNDIAKDVFENFEDLLML